MPQRKRSQAEKTAPVEVVIGADIGPGKISAVRG